ncbi:MAG: SDR family oxidoreductase [Nitrospira sp.]
MTLVVFGATGRTGRVVISHALAAGYHVRALVRTPRLGDLPIGVEIWQGDVQDPGVVEKVIRGTDAVVSCLGAKLLETFSHKGRVNTYGMPHIVASMQKHHVGRIVAMSSYGAGDSLLQMGLIGRLGMRTVMRGVLADMNALEITVQATSLNWTIVRPVALKDTSSHKGLVIDRPGAISIRDWVTRSDVVAYMLACLGDPATFKRTLLLSEPR